MSAVTFVNTYAYSVTYVTDKLLSSLKLIIRLSGLNPSKLTSDWMVLERGIKTWLEGRYLQGISLEIYKEGTTSLVGRWDFEIIYTTSSSSDGQFWIDPDAIRYAIIKSGINPAGCDYRILAETKLGRPDVPGWGSAIELSTDGFVRHSIGTTIDSGQINTSGAYWRKR